MKAQNAWLVLLFAAATTVVLLLVHASASRAGSDAGVAAGVTVRGTVYYSTTPMPGVRVELITCTVTDPPVYSTTTSSTGAYTFTQVPAGDYTIKVYGPTSEYVGWAAGALHVSGADVVLDWYLKKLFDAILPPPFSQVESLSPLFCWEGLPEATRYEFQLNRTSDWLPVENPRNIRDTCYRTGQTLQNGVNYTWMVGAVDAYNHEAGASQGYLIFTVAITPVVATAGPSVPADLTSRDGDIQVHVSGDALANTTVLTYSRASAPPVTAQLAGINRAFYLTATNMASGLPATLVPGQWYSVIVHYRDAEVGLANPNTLRLYGWDGAGWSQAGITSSVNATNHYVMAQVSHFSLFAVLGEIHQVYVPVVNRWP